MTGSTVRTLPLHLLPALLFLLLPVSGEPPARPASRPPLILEEGADYMEQRREGGKSVLYLEGNVRWRRGESRLRCGHARYLEEEGILYLSREVRLLEEGRDLRADRVRYAREEDYAVATGGVVLLLSDGEVEVRSDSMEYALGEREAWAFRRPRLMLRREGAGEEGAVGTRIDGDRLHMKEGLFAAISGDVAISGDSLTGGSDSLHYDLERERITMTGDPWIEVGTYRLLGERINLYIPGRELRRGVSRGGARGEERGTGPADGDPSGSTALNWIEGDSIALTFVDERIDSLVAAPDARSFYRVGGEGTSEENYVLGEEIVLIWRDGRIDEILVSGRGEGVYRKDEPSEAEE